MKNIRAAQAKALDELRASGLVRHTWADDFGVASFARGDFGTMGSAPNTGIQAFLRSSGCCSARPTFRMLSGSFERVRTVSGGGTSNTSRPMR